MVLRSDLQMCCVQTWWRDRTLPACTTVAGGSYEPLAMALVPHNPHLRMLEGTFLSPVAIATAYQRTLRWKEDRYSQYLALLSITLSVVPATWTQSDGGPTDSASTVVVSRSHRPEDLVPQLTRFVREVRRRLPSDRPRQTRLLH